MKTDVALRSPRLPSGAFTLLAASTVFGSLASFGIPFVVFAIPGVEATRAATLSAATMSLCAVAATMALLETHRAGGRPGLASVLARRLAGNPLTVSMLVLSERYAFYPEVIALLVLVSSAGASVSLNLWLTFLSW